MAPKSLDLCIGDIYLPSVSYSIQLIKEFQITFILTTHIIVRVSCRSRRVTIALNVSQS